MKRACVMMHQQARKKKKIIKIMRPGSGHSFRHKPLKKSRIYIVVFLLSLTKSAQKTQREFNYLSNIKLHAIPFQ